MMMTADYDYDIEHDDAHPDLDCDDCSLCAIHLIDNLPDELHDRTTAFDARIDALAPLLDAMRTLAATDPHTAYFLADHLYDLDDAAPFCPPD